MSRIGNYHIATPTKLTQITLGQWMAYQKKYGRDLMGRTDKHTLDYHVDYALCNYCHYTGRDVADITGDMLPDVLREQAAAFASLEKEQAELNYNDTFLWQGNIWKVAPVLQFAGRMTRAEFEISQDIALIFSDLQDGKDEALYNLCAAFFRKDKETYSSYLTDDANERVKMMHDLPLNMALATRAYIIDTINIYLNSVK